MDNRKNIAILGSTGSIGRQTLDIMSEYPDLFYPYAITANTSAELLVEQAIKYRPRFVVIADESRLAFVREGLAQYGDITVLGGSQAIADLMADDNIAVVVTAMVGYSGLIPTIEAIKHGKDIALANKETLVVAGELITSLLKNGKSKLYPVDSEHGAIYQCLVGERKEDVSKLIITASGGPFRTTPKEQLHAMTKEHALAHPNWNMGAKITIDSATMMNKGFEVMEAKWLFDMTPDRIEVVVHPQSIVHSMVEFVDGSVKAQLGLPDMHLPIRYALGLPNHRLASDCRKMRVEDYFNLTFERPDFEKFPLLAFAFKALERGGNIPCALNAANEIAVAAFLQNQIKFTQIAEVIHRTVEATPFIKNIEFNDLVATNEEARNIAKSLLHN